MLLIPAIDLKDGHCVRLVQGDMNQSTTFSDQPEAMAKRWLDAGARRFDHRTCSDQLIARHRQCRGTYNGMTQEVLTQNAAPLLM